MLGDIWKECFLDGMDSSMEGFGWGGKIFRKVFSKGFFKGDFPCHNFSSGNVPNVPFPKRQLPDGKVRPSLAP